MFLPDDDNFFDTIIANNIYLSSNNIPEIVYSILSYLHISGAKYRIYSIKKSTATNITIRKMTEMIESNIIV